MSRPSPLLRRGLIFSLSIITGALASAIWANLLFSNGITGFDVIQIVLFVPGILWVSVFFWSCVMGWGRQMVGGRVPGIAYPEKLEAGQLAPELSDPAATPLAIVVPVRNEDEDKHLAVLKTLHANMTELDQKVNPYCDNAFLSLLPYTPNQRKGNA